MLRRIDVASGAHHLERQARLLGRADHAVHALRVALHKALAQRRFAELRARFFDRARNAVQAGHVVVVFPALALRHVHHARIVRRDARHHARVVHCLQKIADALLLAVAELIIGDAAVVRDRERLHRLHHFGHQLVVLHQREVGQQHQVHLPARRAVALKVVHRRVARRLIVVVHLPRVDAHLFGVQQQAQLLLGREILAVVRVQPLVEMRVAVQRVRADNHPRDAVLAEGHRGQLRLPRLSLRGRLGALCA